MSNEMRSRPLSGDNPITKEVILNAPVSKVWKALTDKNDMKQWYFDVAEFKPEVGFEFQFEGGKDPNNLYLHKCKITEVIPNKKIQYTWRFEGFEGNSYVTFELFSEGNKTRLKLTHEGIETFPKSSDFARENFDMGWTHIIGTSIKNFVEK